MRIHDRVYGEHGVTDQVIIDLIQSPPMQRLKGISQFGMPDELNCVKGFSRFEHSVGVMLALRMHGASVAEQAAGLLHDVSHTAFSHVIDWVVGTDAGEGFQDSQHERYIMQTEIPEILRRHGLDVAQIIEPHHFSLLEQDSPRLCADRIDYSLREMPKDTVARCVPALTTHDGRFAFSDADAALAFARAFLHLQMTRWGGFDAASRYEIFGGLLRYAIEIGAITFDDFWTDDMAVLAKLRASTDGRLVRGLEFLQKQSLENEPKASDVRVKKFRFVDPDVVLDGMVKTASELRPEFASELDAARQRNNEGIRCAIFNE